MLLPEEIMTIKDKEDSVVVDSEVDSVEEEDLEVVLEEEEEVNYLLFFFFLFLFKFYFFKNRRW
jgi:hypothetical protein